MVKRILPQIRRALGRQEELKIRQAMAEEALGNLLKKNRTPSKLFETLTGVKPKERVYMSTNRGSLVFSLGWGDYERISSATGMIKDFVGFTPYNSNLKIPRELQRRIAFLNRDISTIEKSWASDISHERFHTTVPERYRSWKEQIQENILGELGATVYAGGITAQEYELSEEDKKRIEKTVPRRELKEFDNKTQKEFQKRVQLVSRLLKAGVPPKVLAGFIATSNWNDLPKTLKRMFDV